MSIVLNGLSGKQARGAGVNLQVRDILTLHDYCRNPRVWGLERRCGPCRVLGYAPVGKFVGAPVGQ